LRVATETREECWPIYYGDVHGGTPRSVPATHTIPNRGNGAEAIKIRVPKDSRRKSILPAPDKLAESIDNKVDRK
jgi:hypothetical protein